MRAYPPCACYSRANSLELFLLLLARKGMYRIQRLFDNSSTVLVRITGEVEEGDLESWTSFLSLLRSWGNCDIILDFSDVFRIASSAVNVLVEHLPHDLYLMNCSPVVANVVSSFGHGHRLLDKESAGSGFRIRCPDADDKDL